MPTETVIFGAAPDVAPAGAISRETVTFPPGRPLIDPLAILPKPPTPVAPAGPAELNLLPTKDQFALSYYAKQGPDAVSKYLSGRGYSVVGSDANSITFRDKAGKLYHSDDAALLPMLANTLPAIGQTAGTIGGGALTGGLGGEVAGSAVGQALGDTAQQAIYRHYGLGQINPTEIAKNAAIAGAAQGVLGGVVPSIAKNLAGVNMGQAAEAAREGEIAQAGEGAVKAQGESLLKQALNVGKLREDLQETQALAQEIRAQEAEKAAARTATQAGENKFATAQEIAKVKTDIQAQTDAAKEQAAKIVGAQQETGELRQALGTTPEEAAARRGVLIQGDEPWPAEPYFKALNNIQERQGKLFDDVLKPIAKQPIDLNLSPTVQEIRGRAHMAGLSGKTNKLLDEVERMGQAGELTDYQAIAAVQGPREALRAQKAGAEALRMQGQLSRRLIAAFENAPGIGAPLPQGQQAGNTIEEWMNMRSRLGEIARARSSSPIDKAAAHEVMDRINDGLFEAPGLKDPASQLALKTARQQYARFKNVFTPSLTAKVAAARDPVEVANVLFGSASKGQSPKIALNMIDVLKDDPESMDRLRSTYADKVISAPNIKDSRLTLSIHDKNGVLQKLYPDSQYRNLKAWIDTQNYKQFAERAVATPEGQAAFNAEYQKALNTPEGKKLIANLQQLETRYKALPEPEEAGAEAAAQTPPLPATLQQRMAKQAGALNEAVGREQAMGLVDPEQVRAQAMAEARAQQTPQEAAVEKLRETAAGRKGFGGGGMIGYVKRRTVFALLAGYGLHEPAALLMGGSVFGYDALWSLAMATPESANAFYKFASSFAKPGAVRNVGKGLIDVLSAITTNALREEPGTGANPNP